MRTAGGGFAPVLTTPLVSGDVELLMGRNLASA
jgi:hypothetical protein